MGKYNIVIDTNVIISALRSTKGASFKLLSIIDSDLFEFALSVPLFIEYESFAKRNKDQLGLTESVIDDILDYLAEIGNKREIYFLWRPFLKDPKDDLVLELAVESESDFIISYNKNDFKNVIKFGLKVLTPFEFLKFLKVIK
ncbi:MAG: putative toxin-antitoxin system toxin component, PIN family [Deltaproteobacteria bacterium]|jgi:putative PIN family toxin of toxin-antitoxin system|nr:putative toxin-antitoxin system toxin component, PIN family [Deltaproteobacteria bacterium]MBT4268329.1 putative toxin-antitoxin system toxin component, PIN family [Deltaproteobacteria bacterium]MBT4642312.1 putative toxin-antitoxin system toxin component, PIN family [Deltaproteobacteria bacterium]MBT6498966.1 putative toxin-antitoxin system toxin component, PIN family [Deltaproteobacteria bacterium]MBT6610669.1 putative toxin-antitoxin system toxin component, PIN family [Deltaproteobacteria